MSVRVLLLAVTISLIPLLGWSAGLRIYDGPWTEVKPADLAVHPLKDEGYTESWFFMVQGQGNLWLFIHYGISNLEPLSDFNGAIETTVIDDGKVTFVKDKLDAKQIRYQQGHPDLAIGKNTLKPSGNGWALHIEQSGVSLDLTVKPTTPSAKPGRTVYPNGTYYVVDFAAPRAEVNGTLKLGSKTITVTGSGYFDHSVQNYPAHKMADELYSFRGFSDDAGLNYLMFKTPSKLGGAQMPALILMRGNKILARTTAVKMTGSHMQRDKDNDYQYPGRWNFEAKDGEVPITGTITLGKRLQEQNAADDFNVFERTLIKTFVANPMLYRHEGTFQFTIGGTNPATLSGTGVAEIVILRQ